MFHELSLEHVKCFERLDLPVRPLTVLSGLNASGKSTVLQALSLLHQSVVDAEWSGALVLDGSSVKLGAVTDIVDKVHGRRSFVVGLSGEDFSVRWRFGDPASQAREAVTVSVHEVRSTFMGTTRTDPGPPSLPYEALLPAVIDDDSANRIRSVLRRLDHVGAERLGPREIYTLGHEGWHDTVGLQGERAPGAVWWFGEDKLDSPLCLDDAPPTVRGQVQAWLGKFFPGVVLQIDRVPRANALTLGFRTSDATDFHRPQHVGYGITHVLPILVAGLRATAGRVLLVENPESHMHPAGQAAIGAFLARVAASGAQVILETHSDHVLNGIRRAVRKGDLNHEDVAIHFFREREQARALGVEQVEALRIDQTGNIDRWPPGFFDQFDLDMSHLAGLGD